MKLKTFNSKNCGQRMSGSFLSITKSGMLSFSSEACELIGIKNNAKIEFFQDEEEPQDWYVGQSKSEEAFQIREKSKNGVYCIQNAFLARSILIALNIDELKTVRFIISKESQKVGGGG